MNCPRCSGPELIERDREGITVDICPDCRGVWLDRGELEKLVQRAVAEIEAAERTWSEAARPPLPVAGAAQERREGGSGPAGTIGSERGPHGQQDRVHEHGSDRARAGDRGRSGDSYRDGDRGRDWHRDGDRDRHDRDGYRRYRDDDDDDDYRRGRKKGWLERLGDVFD